MNDRIDDYRPLIESALVYAGGTHTFEDVEREVEEGAAQFWPGPTSVIITQIDETPRQKVLLFWLAAGTRVELEVMEPLVIEWGKEEGCTLARMAGRKGWKRSFLMDLGWTDTEQIILEKRL